MGGTPPKLRVVGGRDIALPRAQQPPEAHRPFLDALADLLAAEVVARVMGQSGPRPPRKPLDERSAVIDGTDEEPSSPDGEGSHE